MSSRHLLYVTVALILAVTLFPEGSAPQGFTSCFVCSRRGVADAVFNVVLFAPLGLLLCRAHVSLARIAIMSALLSVGIELTQLVIPGRSTSVSDVVFNTAGAIMGAFAFSWWVARQRE